jgi:PIN domain nuclease of toxin-antitoxin system
VKYLLDTHIFLWGVASPAKLNRQAVNALSSRASELYLSPATSWEIAIKFALGSLPLLKAPSEFVPSGIQALILRSLEITHVHSLEAGALPRHHSDPFDRMLIAQARAEDMIVLTADPVFRKYDVEVLFCGK